MKEKMIIASAIDFGAKNTGVYYAKYPEKSPFEKIEKLGEVVEHKEYTVLLKDRTAARHARRNYTRTKLAKRLLRVILEQRFKFPVREHMQALGFFMNRRGFTYIEGAFSGEHLNNFPKEGEAWECLPWDLKNSLEEGPLSDSLRELAHKDEEKIKKLFEELEKEHAKVKKDLFFYGCVNKVQEACKLRSKAKSLKVEDEKKLSNISKWVIEKLKEEGLEFPPRLLKENRIDLYSYLSPLSSARGQKLAQQLEEIKEKQKTVKSSIWNFGGIENFALTEKIEDILSDPEHKDYEKNHLHHLCYAVYKLYDELKSGARHRSKYFEEVKSDLDELDKHPHTYLRNFAKALEEHSALDKEKFYRLICHISNFELKPLRAYFNDETYKEGDRFHNHKLSKVTARWFLKHWRVTLEKDQKRKVEEYKELREKWGKHKDKQDIISFWLNTDPVLTIPPYQSLTNRRPPHCQSLQLNINYLKAKYPNWPSWLKQLEELKDVKEFMGAYGDKLKKLTGSTSDKQLVSDEQLELRKLRFILDRAKKTDPLKLNEIWSFYHRQQQLARDNAPKKEKEKQKGKMEAVIEKSEVPDELKKELKSAFREEGSFWHFLNKYYQNRAQARAGRYFIHQESKKKWNDDGKLLTVCPHRPRQKRYQLGADIAAILGMSYDRLKEKVCKNSEEIKAWDERKDWEKIESYFKEIKGFAACCGKSEAIQKKHRGSLKYKRDMALKEAKENGEKNLKEDDKEIFDLHKKCERLALELAQKVEGNLPEEKASQESQRYNSIFSFAQIHNILFKDRHGFSKTCPVCSLDNSERMQEAPPTSQNNKDNSKSEDGGESRQARAARLTALSIRLIDGAVMRVCDSLSRHISQKLWEMMEKDLIKNRQIHIPIICEQNRFEFEPSLKKMKNLKGELKGEREKREKSFKDKEERIKKAVRRICAYTGGNLGKGGEIDHIIPRASRYGTLNDEANLIYVSKAANQNKQEQKYFLKDLHVNYKKKIFGKKSDAEIESFIYQILTDKENPSSDENESFAFGRYLSFINLDEKQKICFQHALFLEEGDPLRAKVIRALQNRNRTIVNGTQRYLAQQISDRIWRRAKSISKEKLIEFDYFEYSAEAGEGKSTYELRKHYAKVHERLEKPEKQPAYSHLLDAQMAFLLAANEHRNNGSMAIQIKDPETVHEGIDYSTGEILPAKFFELSEIGEDKFSKIELNRKKRKNGVRLNRQFHLPNFYGENYAPLLIGIKKNKIEVRAGFSWENSVELDYKKSKKQGQNIVDSLPFAKDEKISNWKRNSKAFEQTSDKTANIEVEGLLKELHASAKRKLKHKNMEILFIHWNKNKIEKHLLSDFSTHELEKGKKWSESVKFLRSLSYRYKKVSISLGDKEKSPSNFFRKILDDKEKLKVTIFKSSLQFPARQEWEKLAKAWEEAKEKYQKEEQSDFNEFVRDYFMKREKAKKNNHQKVRKVFSLPIPVSDGIYLQSRRSWNQQEIYQISKDSDSRKDGNKFSRVVKKADGEIGEAINKAFVSKNIFKLKEETIVTDENYENIDPEKWYAVDDAVEAMKGTDLPEGIAKLSYLIDNTTRPRIRITLGSGFKKKMIKGILDSPLSKPKPDQKDNLKKELENASPDDTRTYTGSGFNKEIKEVLREVI